MSSEDLIQMLQTLFPHMNKSDRTVFLKDIQEAAPESFQQAGKGIKKLVDSLN